MSPLAFFSHLIKDLESNYSHLARGNMLSSPAIEYKGRVFAFCSSGNMVIKCKNPEILAEKGFRATSEYRPFKNRMILSDWREVPFYYHEDWRTLAEMALDDIRDEIDV